MDESPGRADLWPTVANRLVSSLLLVAALVAAPAAGAQVLVSPARPGRNNVRYLDFDWRRYDLAVEGGGGVRLYFYRREEEAARIAAAFVRSEYERLSDWFAYRPSKPVPYILYASHREFESTNVFFVNESILGVTSPADLRMALPWWGERRRFREVSTHEMTHQFTIQLVADRAAAAKVESPLSAMPLWFIEGLAEYVAKEGVDPETAMVARDLLIHPDAETGNLLPAFWDDSAASYVATYKAGQLRVAFLAERYGEPALKRILDESPRLVSQEGLFGVDVGKRFREHVARIAGESPETIAERFPVWLRRHSLPEVMRATQEPPLLVPIDVKGEPDDFATTSDGHTLLFRAVSRESGRSRLMLADRDFPNDAYELIADDVPGAESLHAVTRSVVALTADRLAYVVRDGASDVLVWATYRKSSAGAPERFEVGRRHRIRLSDAGLVEAGDPSFDPSGKRLVFFGLDVSGQEDLWLADLGTGGVERLTNDRFAEREPAWTSVDPRRFGLGTGADGTLVFASDETGHGRWNLVAMDPSSGARRRLSDEPFDQHRPLVLPSGEVIFGSDFGGTPNLHKWDPATKELVRLSDAVTGLSSPRIGPDASLLGLSYEAGRFRLVQLPTTSFGAWDARPARSGADSPPASETLEPIPPEAPRYEPWARKNWRLETGLASLGTSSVGQGALVFGDLLGDRKLVLSLAIYGDWTLTDASLVLLDTGRRDTFGLGPFHTFTRRREANAPGGLGDVLYLQREFGLLGLWAHPFGTFSRMELRGVVQGVKRDFQSPVDADGLIVTRVDLDGVRGWRDARGGYDLEGLLTLRAGHDTTRFRFPGGAVGGGSLLFEVGGGWLPIRSALYATALFDAQRHLRTLGGVVLHLRLAGGVTGGSPLGRQFFLSSYDNLRQFQVWDLRLLGRAYTVLNADLTIPLDALVRLAVISNVQAVAGLDLGSVAQSADALWAGRSMGLVLGTNLGLGPFEFRLHFAKPVDLGAGVPSHGWVTNVSLRYLYF